MGLVYSPERVGAGLIPAYVDGQAQRYAAVVMGESVQELCGHKDSDLLMFLVFESATGQSVRMILRNGNESCASVL